jgi:hypothetical protein
MITQETALRIVKQAEEQYNPKRILDLTTLVGRVTDRIFGEDAHSEDGTPAWLNLHGDHDTVVNSSSEEVAERLATRVNAVLKLLNIAHEQEKKLHAVIVAFRALKADLKKHEVQTS